MKTAEFLKNFFATQKKQIFFSFIGGTTLLILWTILYQVKTEPQVPFSDIIDLASENSQENATENNPVLITSVPPSATKGPYKDGTYQASNSIPWGKVTIGVKIVDGKWADLQLINVPDSPPSQYAATILAKQALKAQNEKIDGVSGATYFSSAFRDDLSQIVSQSKN